MSLQIVCGDALTELRKLPDESVHCCVTSPPYWGLRDYGTAQWEGGDPECDHRSAAEQAECGKCGAKRIDAQLGLEKTPEEYVAKMVEIFSEVRRVLRNDGTLWLNLGDSYNGQNPREPSILPNDTLSYRAGGQGINISGLKPKDLCGIPWRVAFALQADGWWLRQDIIWAKPNPMPESVTDRCTKAHEYMFLLTKSPRYFYDAEAIRERSGDWHESIPGREDGPGQDRRQKRPKIPSGWDVEPGTHETIHRTGRNRPSVKRGDFNGKSNALPGREAFRAVLPNRNKRSVWTITTAPYPDAHFATYPPELVKPCILAGTSAKGCCAKCGAPWERVVEKLDQPNPERSSNQPGYLRPKDGDILANRGWNGRPGRDIAGTKTVGWQPTCKCWLLNVLPSPNDQHCVTPCTVLDPFAGSGTTGAVAIDHGRRAILIELNPEYVELINQRCSVMGLALA